MVLAFGSMRFLVHLMPTTFGQFPELFPRTSRVLAGHHCKLSLIHLCFTGRAEDPSVYIYLS
jgi:hypothetical protein